MSNLQLEINQGNENGLILIERRKFTRERRGKNDKNQFLCNLAATSQRKKKSRKSNRRRQKKKKAEVAGQGSILEDKLDEGEIKKNEESTSLNCNLMVPIKLNKIKKQNSEKVKQKTSKIKIDVIYQPSNNESKSNSCSTLIVPSTQNIRQYACQAQVIKIQQYQFQIERNLGYSPYFMFSGFINIEMDESSSLNFWRKRPLVFEQIEKHKQFYQIFPSFNEISNEFEMAISLLESFSRQEEYYLAQLLKDYKQIVLKQEEVLKSIKQSLKEDPERLQQIKNDRIIFRESFIRNMISSSLEQDQGEFFVCIDNEINFEEENFSCPSAFRVTKELLALIGIEDSHVDSFFLRKEAFLYIFPLASRRTMTKSHLYMFLNNQIKYLNIKDFEIQTIDGISIICDSQISILELEYPENLQYPNYSKLPFMLENIIVMKFQITTTHLELLLANRQQSNNYIVSDCEDFEYSIKSSIFLEKYYQKQLLTLFPERKFLVKPKPKQLPLPALKNQSKECGYRQLMFDEFVI